MTIRILTCIIILILLTSCAIANNTGKGHVVLVVAGGISIRDITDPALLNLNDLLQTGSGALMNVRTGRPSKDVEQIACPGMEAGCVSLGAGALAVAGAESRRAADIGVPVNGIPAEALYKCHTGSDCTQFAIVHTEISKMQRANEAASYRAKPGALGSALHSRGINTAAIGNSDIPGLMHREAVNIAMDESGCVDLGNVDSSDLTLADPNAPFVRRTNIDKLLQEYDTVASKCRFIVIDFGDTYRADVFAESCTDVQGSLVRHLALRHLDEFIPKLTSRLDFNKDTLILLSPNYRLFSEIEEERLAPIIIKGPGFSGKTLASPSTRRNGIVTIADVAPTIIALLGANPSEAMSGRVITETPCIKDLEKLNTAASTQGQRQIAMRGSSVLQSVIVVLATLYFLTGTSAKFSKMVAKVALIPLAIPLAMLFLPGIYDGGLIGSVVWLIGLSIFFVGIIRQPMSGFICFCGLLILFLMIDLLRGAPLISASIAGYTLIDGARYYGIGNELMGTMIGAAILGTGAVLSGWNKKTWLKMSIIGLIFICVLIFIGGPKLGANFGGVIAAAPAFGFTLMAFRGRLPGIRGIVIVALVAVLAVGAIVGIDIIRGSASQSHVGRALSGAASGHMGELLLVAQRKMALNFMLVSTSLWSRLLGLSLVCSGVLYWRIKNEVVVESLTNTEIGAITGTCVGIVGAFIFNDSGVVAAATCAVILWSFLAVRASNVVNDKGPESC